MNPQGTPMQPGPAGGLESTTDQYTFNPDESPEPQQQAAPAAPTPPAEPQLPPNDNPPPGDYHPIDTASLIDEALAGQNSNLGPEDTANTFNTLDTRKKAPAEAYHSELEKMVRAAEIMAFGIDRKIASGQPLSDVEKQFLASLGIPEEPQPE